MLARTRGHRGDGEMERIAILREQALVLRTLARSFDIPAIRDRLLELADRCDELARSLEETPRAAGIDDHL